MKILCATDFSERADAAVHTAAALARWTLGTLELAHALPTSTRIVGRGAESREFEGAVAAEARERLAATAKALSDLARVVVSASLLEGPPEQVLLERARAIDADLIVMGAHGRPAFERLLLGSVAERTVRMADRPVLVVPPGAEGWAAGARLPPPTHVLLGLDGRHGSDGALEFVRALRRHVWCDVSCLRLYWPPEEMQRLGLTGARRLETPDPDVVADLERGLRQHVGVLPGNGGLEFVIEPTWGEPAARLLEAALARGANLIVIGAETRHGLGRLTHPAVAAHMAHHVSRVPVVFVPAPPVAAATPAHVPRFTTVLAATDLSPAGNAAVPFAYGLLAGHGGVVELVHVHERHLSRPAYVYDDPHGKLEPDARAALDAELRKLVPPDAHRLGIGTHVTIVDGVHAAEAIEQAAERLGAGAIVLGAHGKGHVAEALMGSVAEAVVRRSRRPVLVVPVRPREA
jgi:nucleotide-binding universal stress UspA family protein